MTRLQTKPVAHARRYRLVQRDQWTGIAPEALDRVVRESDPTSGAVAQHPVDTRRPLGTLRDDQIRNAVRLELAGNPATASLPIQVEVMNHRVFLTGSVRDMDQVGQVERAAEHVPNVGEVLDLLQVDQT